MKEKYNELINKANRNRSSIYYQLNQLNDITGLSTRMLKYRMITVKKKYEGVTSLLLKDGKKWRIHQSIINEFMPVNRKKNKDENNHDWQSFVSWNPYENYDANYHIELINEMKCNLPDNIIQYTVELDKRGINHVHFISDAKVPELKEVVERVISKYFSWYEISYRVAEINNKYSSMSYTEKAPIKNGTI